jgi:hypothetical protein
VVIDFNKKKKKKTDDDDAEGLWLLGGRTLQLCPFPFFSILWNLFHQEVFTNVITP